MVYNPSVKRFVSKEFEGEYMSAIKIAVANQKGGVGKTTSTIEIATILSDLDKKVLVIDFDQQCNLSTDVGADMDKPSIYDLFVDEDPDMENGIQHTEDGFDIIAGSESMSKADTEFSDTPDMYLLGDLMEALEDNYDYIIVDNGPARDKLLNMSYLAADYFIMCIDTSEDSVKGINAIVKDMMKYHKAGKKSLSKAKILGVIMSRYRKTSIGNTIIEIMQDTLRDDVDPILKTEEEPFVMTVREAAVVDEAKVFKKSVQNYKRYSNPAIDYRAIVDEIVRRAEG